MKLLRPPHSRRKAARTHLWRLALFGMLCGFVPFGKLAGPLTQRMLASDPASPVSDFVRSQLDTSDPYVAAFLTPPAIGAELATNPIVTEPSGQAIQETMNLAGFFDAYRHPLATTGQIGTWLTPGFQTNWGPGQELPSSANYFLTHEMANMTPEFLLPEGFTSPFETQDAVNRGVWANPGVPEYIRAGALF